MRILITGGEGRIGRFLTQTLTSEGFEVHSFGRGSLNLLDFNQLKKTIFNSDCYDVLIHTAKIGGRRYEAGTYEDFYKNMLMTENIAKFVNRFEKVFVFNSGASHNRDFHITQGSSNPTPTDVYGLYKAVENRMIKGLNVFSLKLFNVFGPNEEQDRFIKTAIRCCLTKSPLETLAIKKMDFFYEEDLASLILFLIKGKNEFYSGQYDCCYEKHLSLSEILYLIEELTGEKCVVLKTELGKDFTGDSTKLDNIGIKLHGFKEGLIKTIESMDKNLLL